MTENIPAKVYARDVLVAKFAATTVVFELDFAQQSIVHDNANQEANMIPPTGQSMLRNVDNFKASYAVNGVEVVLAGAPFFADQTTSAVLNLTPPGGVSSQYPLVPSSDKLVYEIALSKLIINQPGQWVMSVTLQYAGNTYQSDYANVIVSRV